MNWGNTTATFRWNRVWTDQLSGNFSAILVIIIIAINQ